jgi:hypothetical protein
MVALGAAGRARRKPWPLLRSAVRPAPVLGYPGAEAEDRARDPKPGGGRLDSPAEGVRCRGERLPARGHICQLADAGPPPAERRHRDCSRMLGRQRRCSAQQRAGRLPWATAAPLAITLSSGRSMRTPPGCGPDPRAGGITPPPGPAPGMPGGRAGSSFGPACRSRVRSSSSARARSRLGDPDRRPGHRPGISTGAMRRPKRDRDLSTKPADDQS